MIHTRVFSALSALSALSGVLLCSSTARADIDPLSGIDFVTVGASGNRAYDGPDPQGLVAGRGGVSYEYRIGRFEITTAQWLEYYNAFSARPDAVSASQLGLPVFWGAQRDTSYTGPGTRYRLANDANASMFPVNGLSWRQAAMYCNWLCNEKAVELSARLNGAYDAATFGFSAPGVFTDQATHHPNARYWIPTLDEWLKAVHYDPIAISDTGQQGRWWQQPHGSDATLIYGPPPGFPGGNASNQANSGFSLPNLAEYTIPLGSYPNITSPWGLLDAAGGTSEWMEGIQIVSGRTFRLLDGSQAGQSSTMTSDGIALVGADFPHLATIGNGLRIASSVPSPGVPAAFGIAVILGRRRRRRHAAQERCGARDGGSVSPARTPKAWPPMKSPASMAQVEAADDRAVEGFGSGACSVSGSTGVSMSQGPVRAIGGVTPTARHTLTHDCSSRLSGVFSCARNGAERGARGGARVRARRGRAGVGRVASPRRRGDVAAEPAAAGGAQEPLRL
jgi:hypothetical protein